MLNGIVGLPKVRETSVQGPLGKLGMVEEVSKSKQMVDGGFARSETSLRGAAEAMLLRPIHQTCIEDDDVEPVQGRGSPEAMGL